MRPSVLIVAHSESADVRGRQLFGGWPGVAFSRPGPGIPGSIKAILRVLRSRPRLVYLIDIGTGTAAAAVAARVGGRRVVVDTGDVVFELERSKGSRSSLGLMVVWAGERVMLASAHHVVVRGREHLALISGSPATYAPDLAPPGVGLADGTAVRTRLGLSGAFVVGLVGSLRPAPRLGISYGWDLIEALPGTPAHVAALVVGDGPARIKLERRARELLPPEIVPVR